MTVRQYDADGEGEAPPDGVSFSQVTENGTELDVAFTGLRTSTHSSFSNVPLTSPVVRNTRAFFDLPSPSANSSVRQPESTASPSFDTHRYDTVAGTRPTVNAAVNAGD